MGTKEKVRERVSLKEATTINNEIVVYNDDVNTFDDVIQWLVEICDHDVLQAEQCSIIIHYKGKCIVKSGSYDDLEPRASALLHRGLSAEIH